MTEETKKKEKPVKKKSRPKAIKPLKDFLFAHGKDVYNLKEGIEIEIPEIFLANLKTEKVIK